ncbi:hypothetical protein [Facklamia hominis]
MRSQVLDYPSVEEIEVPETYLRVSLADFEQIFEIQLADMKRKYQQLTNEPLSKFDSLSLSRLGLGEYENLSQVKEAYYKIYRKQALELAFYRQLMPFLLAFYQEASQVVINQDEYDAYERKYLDQIQRLASEEDMTLEEYASSQLHLNQPIRTHIKERILEDFVFELIAKDRFAAVVDEWEYEAFIQERSLSQGLDPIDLKEQISFSNFLLESSQLKWTQELFDYFNNRFIVVDSSEGATDSGRQTN